VTAQKRIVLMPEYGAPPLWTDLGPVPPEQLGLSAELSRSVQDWADEWEHGGGEESSDEEFAARGQRLAARIQEELGPSVIVVYED
jgi:hypothetical protein